MMICQKSLRVTALTRIVNDAGTSTIRNHLTANHQGVLPSAHENTGPATLAMHKHGPNDVRQTPQTKAAQYRRASAHAKRKGSQREALDPDQPGQLQLLSANAHRRDTASNPSKGLKAITRTNTCGDAAQSIAQRTTQPRPTGIMGARGRERIAPKTMERHPNSADQPARSHRRQQPIRTRMIAKGETERTWMLGGFARALSAVSGYRIKHVCRCTIRLQSEYVSSSNSLRRYQRIYHQATLPSRRTPANTRCGVRKLYVVRCDKITQQLQAHSFRFVIMFLIR